MSEQVYRFLGLAPHRLAHYKPFYRGDYERGISECAAGETGRLLRAPQPRAVSLAGTGVRLGMSESKRGAIAFYLPGLQGGGAERVILNLAQGITERGLAVDLVLAAATGPLLDQIPPGVRLVDLKAARVLRSIRSARRVPEAGAAAGPGVVPEPREPGGALGRKTGGPGRRRWSSPSTTRCPARRSSGTWWRRDSGRRCCARSIPGPATWSRSPSMRPTISPGPRASRGSGCRWSTIRSSRRR